MEQIFWRDTEGFDLLARERAEALLSDAAEVFSVVRDDGAASPLMWCHLGELFSELCDLPRARYAYDAALSGDPSCADAWYGLALVSIDCGKVVDAMRNLRNSLTFAPHRASPHFHLGRILDKLGRTEQAEIHWKACLELAGEGSLAEMARRRLAPR
ncbi:MAG: hypothetical protein HQL38_19665 [Alphaproteobacteria bacterium]|nr:hypothetical protein [Alphaproteobacteria bacterium]